MTGVRRINMLQNQLSLFPSVPLPKIESEVDYVECSNCGARLDKDDVCLVKHSNEPYCGDCVLMCESCEDLYAVGDEEGPQVLPRSNEGGRDREKHPVCCNCRFQCADCDDEFDARMEHRENNLGKRICEYCSEGYSSCEGCGDILSSDDAYRVGIRVYCSSCYESAEETDESEEGDNSGPIYCHDYKPSPVFFADANGTPPNKLYFGIEIEVENTKQRWINSEAAEDTNCDLLYCKNDGSLKSGFEIVSHPSAIDFWRSYDFAPFTRLANRGFRSYDVPEQTCGMHVHLSRGALSNLDILKLLRFFRDNPDFVLKVSRRRPYNLNKWAEIDNKNQAHLLRKAKRRRIDNELGGSRYAAINTGGENTVEIRIFRGTLKPEAIKRNLEFCWHLVQYVRTHSLRHMQQRSFLAWLQVIRTPEAVILYEWLSEYGEVIEENC